MSLRASLLVLWEYVLPCSAFGEVRVNVFFKLNVNILLLQLQLKHDVNTQINKAQCVNASVTFLCLYVLTGCDPCATPQSCLPDAHYTSRPFV